MAISEKTTQTDLSQSHKRTFDDLTEDAVYEMYWEQEMSQYDIAEQYNTYQRKVSSFMERNEIPTRGRGEGSALARQANYTAEKTELPETTEKAQDARESTSFGAIDVETSQNIEQREDGLYAVTEYTVSLTGLTTRFTTTEETQLLPSEISL